MVTIRGDVICLKCGKQTVRQEFRFPSYESREECSECGYFREKTDGIHFAAEIGLIDWKSRKILNEDIFEKFFKDMHFHQTKVFPYPLYWKRQGFIKNKESSAGKYLLINSRFSVPSDLDGIEIEWINYPEAYGFDF